MTYRCFNVEIADNIAHIQLKRGDELNTMVPEFWTRAAGRSCATSTTTPRRGSS